MKNKFVPLLSAGLLFTAGCNNDFLTDPNPSAANVANSFNTEAEAVQAVNAIYVNLQGNQMYGREYWWLFDLLSDEQIKAGDISGTTPPSFE